MKVMKKIMYIAAALLVLVGCQKSQEAKENAPANYGTITGKIELPQGPNKISAPTGWEEAETAFTMVWEAGDQIYIYNGSECKQLSNPTIVNGIATFEGELLTDMSEYKVAYGYDPQATVTDFPVEYIADNYHPFAAGTGTEYEFTIANFEPVIGLQLKGTDALTKIEVVLSDKDNSTLVTYTMTFENALQLNESTASNVYFPIRSHREASKMAINFYKNESSADVLIMTKTTTNIPEAGKVTTFPELTVQEPYTKMVNGHKAVQLWENGPYWATVNVNASSPKDYGSFYMYPEFPDAIAGWGEPWRMPTIEELEGLLDKNKCNSGIEIYDEKSDDKYRWLHCTGKGDYSVNSIFMTIDTWSLERYSPTLEADEKGYFWCFLIEEDGAYIEKAFPEADSFFLRLVCD